MSFKFWALIIIAVAVLYFFGASQEQKQQVEQGMSTAKNVFDKAKSFVSDDLGKPACLEDADCTQFGNATCNKENGHCVGGAK